MTVSIKLAPYVKKQNNEPHYATQIIAGADAWNKERWQMIKEWTKTESDYQPVIVATDVLENPTAYQLAPKEKKAVSIYQAGELSETALNTICLSLAQHTKAETVIFTDEGFTTSNLSDYIHRLRTDVDTQERVKLAAETSKSPEQRKAEFVKLFDTMGDNEKLSAFMEWHNKPIYYHEKLQTLYHYTGKKWEAVEDVAMGRLIRNFFLENGITKYNANRIEKMLSLFKYEAERMGKRDPNLLAFANGILHKQTGEFIPHAKEHFLTSFINIDYFSNQTPTPHFDKWLNWVSDNKAEKRDRILAALYMILTNRYEWQLFLEITGEGGTGKSIFNHLAKILAGGEENTAAFSLKDLESPTMRCGLIDKTLCYSPDQESYISDGGILRSITGGDAISFRPLYKGAFKDVIKAVFLITGNSPIIFKEQKGGTSRRRVIFQFNKVVTESEKDYHLKDKLEQEAGGIVRRLLDKFPAPMTAKALLEAQKTSEEALEVKEETDHILQFAKHFEAREIINGLTLGSSRRPQAHRTALHSAYLYYCERMGIINPLQRNRFRLAFEYALKERGSKNRLMTRLKDGLNVTNIYYINIEHSLKDWDN